MVMFESLRVGNRFVANNDTFIKIVRCVCNLPLSKYQEANAVNINTGSIQLFKDHVLVEPNE